MRSIWYNSKSSTCVKAGDMNVITGYDNIINMWDYTLNRKIISSKLEIKNIRFSFMVSYFESIIYY